MIGPSTTPSIKRRHNARVRAMQALYQRRMAGHNLDDLLEPFDHNSPKVDQELFEKLVEIAVRDGEKLTAMIEPLLDRPLLQLDGVEWAVLMVCSAEMLECIETPYPVVINEGVEMAKQFGGIDSHKYINGILDKIASECRTAEVSAR